MATKKIRARGRELYLSLRRVDSYAEEDVMEDKRSGKLVLLCAGGSEPAMDWELVSSLHNVVQVAEWRWAAAALETGVRELGHEIHSVIFDKSTDALSFLQFLTTVPYEFRGDILFIESGNRAFLSSCTPRDGRILYQLTARDLDFYIQAHLGWRVETWNEPATVAHA